MQGGLTDRIAVGDARRGPGGSAAARLAPQVLPTGLVLGPGFAQTRRAVTDAAWGHHGAGSARLLSLHRQRPAGKSINSLLGLHEGIAIDGRVTPGEIGMLSLWLADHQDVAQRHPYNELVPALAAAVSDGVLDAEACACT